MPRTDSWTRQQSAIAVSAYAEMLQRELRGERYTKSEYNRRVQEATGRSHGSVEFKFRNLSAVFTDFGYAYVKGYVPAVNYQGILAELAAMVLERDVALEAAMRAAAENPAETKLVTELAEAEAPSVDRRPARRVRDMRVPRITNWLQVEATRRSRGELGERLVLEWEDRRLRREGRADLARRIEHTAVSEGDGAGFDIQSFEVTGADRLIEVKTTSFHEYTPFFVTSNEVTASSELADRWHLYRVYDVLARPRFYRKAGALGEHFVLEASQFEARVG